MYKDTMINTTKKLGMIVHGQVYMRNCDNQWPVRHASNGPYKLR